MVGSGAEGLLAGLKAAAKVPVRQADTFDSAPMTGQGVLLCVGHEEVRAYVYQTADLQAAAVHGIDPKDPSHVGNAIVEWTGNPRFWQRDRVIVLYMGTDASTEALLISMFGQPFAKGAGAAVGGPRINAC